MNRIIAIKKLINISEEEEYLSTYILCKVFGGSFFHTYRVYCVQLFSNTVLDIVISISNAVFVANSPEKEVISPDLSSFYALISYMLVWARASLKYAFGNV